MYQMIPAVFRVSDTGKTNFFPGVPVMTVHQIPEGDDPLFQKSGFYIFRLNKLQKLFQILLFDILLCIGCDRSKIPEAVTCFEAVLHIVVRLIAHALILVQIQVIDTPVVRGKCRDHSVLFFLLLLLLQQLVLKRELAPHLLLLDAVFRVGSFLLQCQSGIPARLTQNKSEHADQYQRRQRRLEHASADNSVRDGADFVADDTLPDQIGQKPVGSRDRHIAERLPDPVVCKADFALIPLTEVLQEAIVRIARIIIGILQCIQEVVLHRQSAQDRIGQGYSFVSVNITEGCAVRLRIQ